MKNLIFSTLLIFMVVTTYGQEKSLTTKTSRIGWFITGEYSSMFLDDHVGNAVGFSAGVNLFKEHLKIGFFNYGRSGPINPKTFNTPLPDGVTYKGRNSIDVRADHGAFGLITFLYFSKLKMGNRPSNLHWFIWSRVLPCRR